MNKPSLVVIAGCNGSGKSTFSSVILPENFSIFDADKRKKEIYDAFKFDFELRDLMAWNQTNEEFHQLVLSSIATGRDFAYETNFNADPLYWIKEFIQGGYSINLIFFCLESVELAKERVAIRFENGGHYVTNEEVEKRYFSGFQNLNKLYSYFDAIFLLEASKKTEAPKLIVEYQKELFCTTSKPLPEYIKSNCPEFLAFLSSIEKK